MINSNNNYDADHLKCLRTSHFHGMVSRAERIKREKEREMKDGGRR